MAKIAFIARNAFQAQHIASLAIRLGGTIVGKHNVIAPYAEHVDVLRWGTNWAGLDTRFDVILAQGPAPDIDKLHSAKVAFIQYGYAKSPYNFGGWRALADLNIAYGPYAEQRFAHFSPAVALGHPRMQDAMSEDFIREAKERYGQDLDPSQPTVLVAPTWGDLSSLEHYADSILAQNSQVNLLLKLHHNTVERNKTLVRQLEAKGARLFGGTDDLFALMHVSDVVVSDYSGAIFDAVMLAKPVVLLDVPAAQLDAAQKMDNTSLEIVHRADIGYICDSPSDFAATLDLAMNGGPKTSVIVDSLFSTGAAPLDAIGDAISDLAQGKIVPSQMQSYAMAYARKQAGLTRRLKRAGAIAICAALVASLATVLVALL